jgi:hypothetical protein
MNHLNAGQADSFNSSVLKYLRKYLTGLLFPQKVECSLFLMFQLNTKEFENLKFHFGTSSWGGTRKLPRAFTEQGIAMLSSVLRSKRAIEVNIAIMRAFVRLREILADNVALRRRIEKHDEQIKYIFKILGKMLQEPAKSSKPFGFHRKTAGQK